MGALTERPERTSGVFRQVVTCFYHITWFAATERAVEAQRSGRGPRSIRQSDRWSPLAASTLGLATGGPSIFLELNEEIGYDHIRVVLAFLQSRGS
jgi:hypothetical protein